MQTYCSFNRKQNLLVIFMSLRHAPESLDRTEERDEELV